MTSVALICTANRCRSLMAHAIFVAEARRRSLAVEVYSAGILDFSDVPPLIETARTCLHYDTPPPNKAPTWIRELPLDSINRFLVMERNHADVLRSEYRIPSSRVSLLGNFDPQRRGLEIADPFGRGKVAYESSYELIRDCIIGYLDTTAALASERPRL